MSTYNFDFKQQLPTVEHVVKSITDLAPGGSPDEKKETKLRKNVICAYIKQLIEIWTKAFANGHIISIRAINKKIRKELEAYYHVYTTKRNKRLSEKEWQKEAQLLFDIKNADFDPESLDDMEKKFYYDQKSDRKMYLSDAVDVEFVTKELEIAQEQSSSERMLEDELSYIFDDENQDDSMSNVGCDSHNLDVSNLNVSLNRSGVVRTSKVCAEMVTQTDQYFEIPTIRNTRNCTDDIKRTCVEVSVKCGISAPKAALAVQIVCKSLYKHQFYLTKEEAIQHDPSLVDQSSQDDTQEPEEKKQRLDKKGKVPTSRNDYLPYKNVLPNPRTITDYKQYLAVQAESDASNALYNKSDDIKCTLHYDTTSRCKIDGDWPAIILNFGGKQRFSLRPLYFAYEDRKQIVRLLVETLERLAILVTQKEVGKVVTARDLWENVTVIMTDAVGKNLHIEDDIASALNSNYKPLHLLCKAHTVEALDRSNIAVLGKLESKVKFREALESANPAIKSFLRGEKSVAVSAIKSIINFVSHDKSATSSNQADLFDHILERENQVKHISLYQERRFTKLGYSCASILDALPFICMVINETHLSNQHVDIVRMLLDSELLISELNVLAYFTYKVSLPLLNAVEVASQEELCQIFPKLHQDLMNGSMETLSLYSVKYRHIDIKAPESDLEIELLKEMCLDAAKTIELQCGREYGFGSHSDAVPRATEIHKLSEEERKDLEKSNIIGERELGVFDHRAAVAKSRNHKFKAKSLRNDMVMHKSSFQSTAEKVSKIVVKIINDREADWTEQQKDLYRKKIEENLEKAQKASNYTSKLLQRCKTWGGPACSVEELQGILTNKPDISEHIVRTELAYYRDTHRADVIADPHLFKLNKLSHEDRLGNLCILLAGTFVSAPIALPKISDALVALGVNPGDDETEIEHSSILEVNQACVTLWLTDDGYTWCIGYCKKVLENGEFIVEHLQRVKKSSNLKWRYPDKEDILTVEGDQLLNCDLAGDWDVLADRNMTFTLHNHAHINQKFLELQ